MLKLTARFGGAVIYIQISYIVAIEDTSAGASIEMVSKENLFHVKETAQEIMAMDPMVYFMHPPMIVPGGFSR